MKKKVLKISLFLVVAIILISSIFLGSFFLTSYKPTSAALSNIDNSVSLNIDDDNLITLTPKNTNVETGLIIYPGAKVEPESYIPLADKIAEAGYEVVITPMPLNFAIFDSEAADKAISHFPNIKHWAISGHSLGGVMAAKYASEHSNIDGVIFYASYPQDDALKNSDVEVTSIYGSLDGVADLDKIANSKDLLPSSTDFVELEGGNHAQFGSYGEQSGDNPATISNDEQISEAATASINLLDEISK